MQHNHSVDDYLSHYSGNVLERLNEIRRTIREMVPPDTVERIAYGIPTYTWHGNLIHFGGYEHHVSVYPGSMPIRELESELRGFKTAKGTVQFPLDKPLPLDLIKKLTLLAIERNKSKQGKKS